MRRTLAAGVVAIAIFIAAPSAWALGEGIVPVPLPGPPPLPPSLQELFPEAQPLANTFTLPEEAPGRAGAATTALSDQQSAATLAAAAAASREASQAAARVISGAFQRQVVVPFQELDNTTQLSAAYAGASGVRGVAYAGALSQVAVDAAQRKQAEAEAAGALTRAFANRTANTTVNVAVAVGNEALALANVRLTEAEALAVRTLDFVVFTAQEAQRFADVEPVLCDRVAPMLASVHAPAALLPPSEAPVACRDGSLGASALDAAIRAAGDAHGTATRVHDAAQTTIREVLVATCDLSEAEGLQDFAGFILPSIPRASCPP